MFDFGLPAGNQSNIEALITRLGIGQQQPAAIVAQPRTVINDLDELFSDLSTDQRKAVESNDEYNIALGNLLQKYLMYSLSHTTEGTQFILNPGRKLAQNLLDTTKRVVADLDKQKQMNSNLWEKESLNWKHSSYNKIKLCKIKIVN